MPEWRFTVDDGDGTKREPVQGEFFATESIDTVVDSLVREFIQNSLDAALQVGEPVEVWFSVGELPPADDASDELFGGLWPHLRACDERAAALAGQTCRYLVAEDFRTTGLRGDPAQLHRHHAGPGEPPNDFYYFVRTEGDSEKSTADRGNWGIGKFTYPMASNVNAFFTLTIRDESPATGGPGPLLIGQAILRHHDVGGDHFTPDGWWGRSVVRPSGRPVAMPLQGSDDEVARFTRTFGLARDGQTGLSIVVPFVSDAISPETLVRSILKNYAAAILHGQLEAVVRGSNSALHELRRTNLLEMLEPMRTALDDQVIAEIDLLSWAVNEGQEERIDLAQPEPGVQTKWGHRLTEHQSNDLRQRLDSGRPICVRVPIHVAPKSGAASWSYADVVLRPEPDSSVAPSFYREGIRISEVRGTKSPGIRAIVSIDDPPLAELLGAAEGPAHVDWQATRERFSGRYRNGKNVLAFVKGIPAGLIKQLRSIDEAVDLDVAANFFALPAPAASGGNTRRKHVPDSPTPPPRPSAKPIAIAERRGGFVITAGEALGTGDQVLVELAYDVRRGNPLDKWKQTDFTVEQLDVATRGGTIVRRSGNQLAVVVTDPSDFEVRADGFDVNRDLFVHAGVDL